MKDYYDVDDKLKDWVMGSAAKKWRDFKSDLKALHFDETKTDEELFAARDERVSPTDWEWLIDYWRGDEAKKEMDDIANDRPELLEKTIQQGDLFSHVLGKERNGYVRSIGLGPSAGDLRMPGAIKLKSTKLQMAEEEAKEALWHNALLRERIDQLESATNTKVAALMEAIQEMQRTMLRCNGGENVEANPQYGSNSPIHEDMRVEPEYSVGESAAAENLDVQEEAAVLQKKKEAGALQKKKEAALLEKKKEAALLEKKKEAALLEKKEATLLEKKESTLLRRKKEAAVTQKNH